MIGISPGVTQWGSCLHIESALIVFVEYQVVMGNTYEVGRRRNNGPRCGILNTEQKLTTVSYAMDRLVGM